MSYQAKIQAIDSNAVLLIEKCKSDYQSNRYLCIYEDVTTQLKGQCSFAYRRKHA